MLFRSPNALDTRTQIINLLKEHPEYTLKDLMKILHKADGTIKEHISKLKKDGCLERVGGRKEGCWKIIDSY